MTEDKGGDLLCGYVEIAEYLNLKEGQVKHLAERPGSDFPVFNLGGGRRRAALKSRLDKWLAAQADKPALDRLADDGGKGDCE